MEIPDHIYTLIAKKLDGEASSEESVALSAWIAQDPANHEIFEHLQEIHNATGKYLQQPVDTNVAWQKVAGRIRQNAPVIQMTLRRAMSIAAIFILVVAGAWFSRTLFFGATWEKAVAVKENVEKRLPDGTVVWLRKGGTLEWHSDFADHREIRLNGEAFFDVQHNAEKPFTVSTGQSVTTVLGTAFSIRSVGGFDQVIVTRGKVNVAPVTANKPVAQLLPGDKLILSKDKLMRSSVSDSNYIAWKTGVLNFRDVNLERALRSVSDFYQIAIKVDAKDKAQNAPLTASFDHEPLEKVLNEISLITGLDVAKQPDGSYLFLRK